MYARPNLTSLFNPRAAAHLAAAALAAITLAAAPAARADDFVATANSLYSSVLPSQRAETTLFPAIAKLKAPPAAAGRLVLAILLPATSASWPEVAAWCTSEESKAALAALAKVTSEDDWQKAPTIALPYGADKTDPDLVALDMYVELGDPATLALADFKYLPAMERLSLLIHTEATRLAATGEPAKALELMVRSTLLGRQMCERGFFKEQRFGYSLALTSLERIRDVMYMDLQSGSPKLTAETVRDQVKRLREDGTLGTNWSRLSLPKVDRIAGEQLLSRIMVKGAGADDKQFSKLLTQLGDPERPLRKFSDFAKWDAIRSIHANEADTLKQLNRVFGDWETRWKLLPNDAILKALTDFQKTSRARFGSVDKLIGNLDNLFELRTRLIVESGGTRAAMGCYGFYRQYNTFPVSIVAGAPNILREKDVSRDPFTGARLEHFKYLIPGKGVSPLFEMQVFNGSNVPAFAVTLNDETFVIYSVGPDGNLNGMRRATQMILDDKGDYLIFPPITSLFRKHMIETGNVE